MNFIRFKHFMVPVLFIASASFILFTACDSPMAPESREFTHSEFTGTVSSLKADNLSGKSCKNVSGEVTGVVDFINGPFLNTITGDLNGQIGAYYGPNSDVRGNGKWGADLFEIGHNIITADGTIVSEDEGTASPVPSSEGSTIRVTNRYNIVGGDGLYADASGNMKTHGTITFLDFAEVAPGVFAPVVLDYDLTYHGRICAPGLAQ